MKIKIGLIMSKSFDKAFSESNIEIPPDIELIKLIALDNSDIAKLYREYSSEVDCFVLSGLVFYFALTQVIKRLELPVYFINELYVDIEKVFFKLLLKDRNFDFSRVFIDIALPYNNYLDLKSLLPKEQWPVFNSLEIDDLNTFTKKTFEKHVELHRSGKIDLSLTRLGTFEEDLTKLGYPCIYLSPPKSYMVSFFAQILRLFLEKETQNQLPSVIMITPDFSSNQKQRKDSIRIVKQALTKERQLNGYSFNIKDSEGQLEVMTNYEDIKRLSKNFESLEIIEAIKDSLPAKVRIGIGVGTNLYQARLQAEKAIYMAKSNPEDIYFINEKNEILGPLNKTKKIKIKNIPDKELQELASKYQVNHLNLQKMIALTKLKKSTVVSSDELAQHLEITPRSANRILNTISENNGDIRFYYEKQANTRGRPKRYAELKFAEKYTLID